jgi:hypothetical protein
MTHVRTTSTSDALALLPVQDPAQFDLTSPIASFWWHHHGSGIRVDHADAGRHVASASAAG